MGGFSLSEDTYGGEYEMPDGTRVYVSSDQPSEASEEMPHAGGIKPNNQPSPAPAGNTQGIIVPQTAPEASGAGNSAPTPEPTEEEEGWWGSWGSALVHGTLDVVGLIPVVGEVADGVNAVLYLAEGKKAEAVISMLAMAPFGGQAATVAKLGMKGAEATKAAGKATAEAGAKATREGAESGAEQASKRATTGKDGGHVDGPKKQGDNEGKAGEVPNSRVSTGPTRASVQSQLDNLPSGQGAGYHVRQNADGNFSVVRSDAGQSSPLKVTDEGHLYSPVSFGSGRGRLGNAQTRAQNQAVADELSSRGWDVTNIGRTEEYIPGAQGGTQGSVWIDITAEKTIGGNQRTLRVQTVDTLSDGLTPTQRELDNAARARELLRSRGQNPHILLVPKSP